jgi:hypothetical protein
MGDKQKRTIRGNRPDWRRVPADPNHPTRGRKWEQGDADKTMEILRREKEKRKSGKTKTPQPAP